MLKKPLLGPDNAMMLLLSLERLNIHYHEQELAPKEGNVQYLLDLEKYQTVVKLLKSESGITMFYIGTIDARHEKKLQKAYVKSVSGYIHYIRMKKTDHYDVRIFVEHGRLKVEINSEILV